MRYYDFVNKVLDEKVAMQTEEHHDNKVSTARLSDAPKKLFPSSTLKTINAKLRKSFLLAQAQVRHAREYRGRRT